MITQVQKYIHSSAARITRREADASGVLWKRVFFALAYDSSASCSAAAGGSLTLPLALSFFLLAMFCLPLLPKDALRFQAKAKGLRKKRLSCLKIGATGRRICTSCSPDHLSLRISNRVCLHLSNFLTSPRERYRKGELSPWCHNVLALWPCWEPEVYANHQEHSPGTIPCWTLTPEN